MHRSPTAHHVARLCLALGLVVSLACKSGGPEFGDGQTRVVEGRLEGEITSQTDFFLVTRSGTISVQLTTLSVVDGETGDPIEAPELALSVGQPNPADETICQATFSQLLEQGESFSVLFPEGLFCIVAFRRPNEPPDTVIDYVVTLTGAFS